MATLETTWTVAKRAWCCVHERTGCPTHDAHDCEADLAAWELTWPESKKVWCCAHRQVGCPCEAQCSSAGRTASCRERVDWALKVVHGRGACPQVHHLVTQQCESCGKCPAPTVCGEAELEVAALEDLNLDCTAPEPDTWPLQVLATCCQRGYLGCAAAQAAALAPAMESYDCQSGLDTWEDTWTYAQAMWCCRHRGVGCPDGAPATTSSTTTTTTTTTMSYDCQDGLDRWMLAWSYAKASWCCEYQHLGCLQGETPAQPETPAPATTTLSAHAQYHCHRGTPSFWTSGKKQWCCLNEGMGCDVQQPVATAEAATDTVTTLGPASYDCFDGLLTWQKSWDVEKRAWCCTNAHLGCGLPSKAISQASAAATVESPHLQATSQEPLPEQAEPPSGGDQDGSTTTSIPFTCQEDILDWHVWSAEKQRWCCTYQGVGCKELNAPAQDAEAETSPTLALIPPKPFDCLKGLQHWRNEWSEAKRSWCCDHDALGCDASDCHEHLASWQASWSHEKQAWCCKRLSLGCPDVPSWQSYDCTSRLSESDQVWPRQQRDWCCTYEHLGCPEQPDMSDDAVADASVPEPAAEPTQMMVTDSGAEPFDCEAAQLNWQMDWSSQQKDWCCSNSGVGCDGPMDAIAEKFEHPVPADLPGLLPRMRQQALFLASVWASFCFFAGVVVARRCPRIALAELRSAELLIGDEEDVASDG